VLEPRYEERAFMGTYLKLAMMDKKHEVLILSNQKKEQMYQWNDVDNSLKNLPMNIDLKKHTIANYQTADYLFTNGLLK
jgi:hypothetical protein